MPFPRRIAALACGVMLAVSSAACSVSQEQEVELGDEYASELQKKLPLLADPALQAAFEDAVAPIAAVAARRDLTWRFHLVDGDVVNAFALPGGHIYFYRGLIERTSDYAEFASVVGHEIGHVDLRHSAEQLGKQRAAQIGIGLVSLVVGANGIENLVLDLGAQAAFAKFSRDDEREADSVAVEYLARTGVDPAGAVRLFRTLEQVQRETPNAVAQWFGSHPLPAERITYVQGLIGRSDRAPAGESGAEQGAEAYEELKRRLAELPPAPEGAGELPE